VPHEQQPYLLAVETTVTPLLVQEAAHSHPASAKLLKITINIKVNNRKEGILFINFNLFSIFI
jgi:hypothetical protein